MHKGLVYHFGPFRLDAGRRRLHRGADVIPLTPKAVDVLLLLVERAQQVIDKDEFLERLWPDTIVAEANLTQQIFTLRKVLGERAADRTYIATVPRRGYRFVADVRTERAPRDVVPAPGARTLRLHLLLPGGAPVARLPVPVLALSPDGGELLYVARTDSGTALYRRLLDELDVERIPGTDGATTPAWSADGAWFAFAAGTAIHRMSRSGGAAARVADVSDCRGLTWVGDRIVFAPGPAEGLWSVPAAGGIPRRLTDIDFPAGERTHRWPCAVGHDAVAFTIGSAGISSFDEAAVAMVSLADGICRKGLVSGSDPRGGIPGLLTVSRQGAVFASPLASAGAGPGELTLPVIDNVATENTGVAHYTTAPDGTIVYLPGTRQAARRELFWIRDGRREPLGAPAADMEEPRLSPDCSRLATGIRDAHSDVWIWDVTRGGLSRLTHGGDNFAPIWSPDGEFVVFSSNRLGPTCLYRQRSHGWEPELLVQSQNDLVPGSFSPDNDRLLYTEYHPVSGADIWMHDLRSGRSEAIVRTPFNEYAPAWHPRAPWFACCSDETGVPEIYLYDLGTTRRAHASLGGGSEPRWSADGRYLYFRTGAALVRAAVTFGAGGPVVGAPETVLDVAGDAGAPTGLPNFDVAPDGALVIVQSSASVQSSTSLVVMVNWTSSVAAAGTGRT